MIGKNFPKLSLSALGVLGTMLNDPESDYCTIDKLCTIIPKSKRSEIKKAVDELLENNYLIEISDNRVAVNKQIIVNMKIMHGYIFFNMEE